MSLLELSCQLDGFCRTFLPTWRQLQLESGTVRCQRARQLSLSEIMTILIGHLRSAVDHQTQVQHEEPLTALADKLLLRKRALIETILDQLRNISQIEHTRRRSANNFVVNVLFRLIAYCQPAKKHGASRRLAALDARLT